MTFAAITGVGALLYLAWSRRVERRRARWTAERLHWLAVKDEREAQSTLRPRSGNVVASVQTSPNGYHRDDD